MEVLIALIQLAHPRTLFLVHLLTSALPHLLIYHVHTLRLSVPFIRSALVSDVCVLYID